MVTYTYWNQLGLGLKWPRLLCCPAGRMIGRIRLVLAPLRTLTQQIIQYVSVPTDSDPPSFVMTVDVASTTFACHPFAFQPAARVKVQRLKMT